MSKTGGAWECALLAMAQQGLENETMPDPLNEHSDELQAAYVACDEIANQHSHTFYMASRPLPEPKRKAVRSLYAFCRITDDLIDRSNGNLAEGLAAWASARWRGRLRATTRSLWRGATRGRGIASQRVTRNNWCRGWPRI